MAAKKRRTEIQIETHEITIIRYGALRKVSPSEGPATNDEVRAYSEDDSSNAIERFDEHDTDEPRDGK